jgi:Kef-type K+ transport system membrane component KefB
MTTTITLVLGLLVATVVFASLATRLQVPYAILLVLGGALLGFLPGLPEVELNPELILFLFLPPLVYSSAWQTSWREFRANLRPILSLAIGLVLFTTVCVAVVAHTILGLPWSIAFVLGAVLSPTDTVAATAIAQRMGLSRRIMTVLLNVLFQGDWGNFGLLALCGYTCYRLPLRWAWLIVAASCIALAATNGLNALLLTRHLSGNSPLVTPLLIAAFLCWTSWTRRSRDMLVLELQEVQKQLRREMAHTGELAATRERTRVARDLHDVLAHSLRNPVGRIDAVSPAGL